MNDVEALTALNEEYLRCYQDGDADGFRALIHDDFMETTADGELLDRPAFLAKIADLKGQSSFGLGAGEVVVRVFGDAAIVHAVTLLRDLEGGCQKGGRYTDVWVRVRGRWRAIAAQVGRKQLVR